MAGLGSFIEGAMQGYSYGEGHKDRRRSQKIEDKLLERDSERFEWERGNQQWNESERQRTRAEQDRVRAQEAADREFYRDLYGDTKDGFEKQGEAAPARPGRSVMPQGQGEGQTLPQGAVAEGQANARAKKPIIGEFGAPPAGSPAQPPQAQQPAPPAAPPIARTVRPTARPDAPQQPVQSPAQASPTPNPHPASRTANPELAASALRFILRGQVPPNSPELPPMIDAIRKDGTPEQQEELDRWIASNAGGAARTPQPDTTDDARAQRGFGRTAYMDGLVDAPNLPSGGSQPRPSRSVVPQAQPESAPAPQAPPVAQGSPAVRNVDPNAPAVQQDWQRFRQSGDVEGALQSIQTDLLQGNAGPPARPITQFGANIGDYFTKTPEQGEQAGQERQRVSGALEWYRSPEARAAFSQTPELLDEAKADPVGVYERMAGAAGPQGTPAPAGGEAPQPAAVPQSQMGPRRSVLTGEGQAQPAPGQPPVSPQDPPSVQAAAATAPDQSDVRQKSDGTVTVTPAQRERATDDFMTYYAENAVPKIVERMLSQGNIEQAQAFDEWSKSTQAKSQLRSWSKALHAYTIGDEDGLFDNLVETYNQIDDGFEANRGKSGFIRDSNGRITGAEITFRNTSSGEEWTRVYEGQDELIQEGIYALDAEVQFPMLFEQMMAAQQLQAEVGARDAEAREEIDKKFKAEIAELRKQYTDQAMLGGAEMPSPEEILREARENVSRRMAAAGQGLLTPQEMQEPPANYTE